MRSGDRKHDEFIGAGGRDHQLVGGDLGWRAMRGRVQQENGENAENAIGNGFLQSGPPGRDELDYRTVVMYCRHVDISGRQLGKSSYRCWIYPDNFRDSSYEESGCCRTEGRRTHQGAAIESKHSG